MEQNKSAILQMLMGERGNFECIRFSEEYRKARKKSLDKLLEFEKQLKKYPQIFELYKEAQTAADLEYVTYAEELYKEAFSFGLAIGQEVFNR